MKKKSYRSLYLMLLLPIILVFIYNYIPMQYVYFSLVLMFAFMAAAYLCEVLLVVAGWNEREGE